MKKTLLWSMSGLALLLSLGLFSSLAIAGHGQCTGEWSGIDDNGDKVSGNGTCTGPGHCTGLRSRISSKETKH